MNASSIARSTPPHAANSIADAMRAAAEDAALMVPVTVELQERYPDLTLPVVIIAGADDQIADVGLQSERLHHTLPQSEFITVPGMGHMIHHLAPRQVIEAIDRSFELARDGAAG